MAKSNNIEFIKSIYEPKDFFNKTLAEIVFCGRSNVGKSSLINALLKTNIARVSATPGRTQAINYFLIDKSYYLVDIPGYGYAKMPKTLKSKLARLLEYYFSNNSMIKLILLLLDFRHSPSVDDIQMLDWLKQMQKDFIICFTKCDKISKTKRQKQLSDYFKNVINDNNDNYIITSAIENIGLKELNSLIKKKMDV